MEAFLAGDYASAIEQFDAALTSASEAKRASLLCNKALCELHLELPRKALKSSMDALDLDPDSLRAAIVHGQALQMLKRETEAQSVWQRAKEGALQKGVQDLGLIIELDGLLKRSQAANLSSDMPAPASATTPSLSSPAETAPPEVFQVSLAPPLPSPPPLPVPIAASSPGKTASPAKAPSPSPIPAVKPSPSKSKSLEKTSAKKSKALLTPAPMAPSAGMLLKLQSLYKFALNNNGDPIDPLTLQALRHNLSHASGEPLVDDLIALGYLQVNTGQLPAAIEIFTALLEYRSDLPAPCLGLGSAHAMCGKFDQAIIAFTEALQIDATLADAWKRRGQTKAARGLTADALSDLDRALELGNDPDCHTQKGMVHHQVKNYSQALKDFRKAEKAGIVSASLQNFIGMCEGQTGNLSTSIDAHKAAIRMDGEFREAILNCGQMYKELGRDAEAFEYFQKVVDLDNKASPSTSGLRKPLLHVYSYRSQMYYGLGDPRSCLSDCKAALTLQGKDKDAATLVLAALSCVSLGMFREAVVYFDLALVKEPDNVCWYQREMLLYFWAHLDTDVDTFSIDADIDPRLKYGWCMRGPWRLFIANANSSRDSSAPNTYSNLALTPHQRYQLCKDIPPVVGASANVDNNLNESAIASSNPALTLLTAGAALAPESSRLAPAMTQEAALALLTRVSVVNKLAQLNCQGFLRNKRQHAMFALATKQMSVALSRHVDLIRLGSPGVQVANNAHAEAASGKNAAAGASSSGSGGGGGGPVSPSRRPTHHTFGWRDLFDIAVRWRQISEPQDPVWWIDLMPEKAFSEGFGLQTPITTGQLRTVRYSCFEPAAFALLKAHMQKGFFSAAGVKIIPNEAQRGAITASQTLAQIREVARGDLYVILPCVSSVSDRVYEGTRLTLVAVAPEGFEFTIRTPSTHNRWRLYDEEMSAAFGCLVDALVAYPSPSPSSVLLQPSDPPMLAALSVFYYWVTFAPLSRGTAICGYVLLSAVALSCGAQFRQGLPDGQQMDWTAILSPDLPSFLESAKGWIVLESATDGARSNEGLEMLGTLRGMMLTLAQVQL